MKLELAVLNAKDLPKLNPKLRQMPYCDIHVDEVEQTYQTKSSKNATRPEWNEKFTFENINRESLTVTITVLHKQQVISAVNFTISEITPSQMNQDFDLTTDDPEKSGGKIWLALTFIADENDKEFHNDAEEEEVLEENVDNNSNNEPRAAANASSPGEQPKKQASATSSPGADPNQKAAASTKSASQTPTKSPGSPRRGKLDRTREKIVNDNEDPEEIENKAKETAQRLYNAFLKQNADLLLDNSKLVSQIQTEEE